VLAATRAGCFFWDALRRGRIDGADLLAGTIVGHTQSIAVQPCGLAKMDASDWAQERFGVAFTELSDGVPGRRPSS
jgi:hypothetical protein